VAYVRAVLRALLTEPLRFTAIVEERRRGYAFEGTIALDRLLMGVVELPMPFLRPYTTKMVRPHREQSLCTGPCVCWSDLSPHDRPVCALGGIGDIADNR
jgi:hypothetical protein